MTIRTSGVNDHAESAILFENKERLNKLNTIIVNRESNALGSMQEFQKLTVIARNVKQGVTATLVDPSLRKILGRNGRRQHFTFSEATKHNITGGNLLGMIPKSGQWHRMVI